MYFNKSRILPKCYSHLSLFLSCEHTASKSLLTLLVKTFFIVMSSSYNSVNIASILSKLSSFSLELDGHPKCSFRSNYYSEIYFYIDLQRTVLIKSSSSSLKGILRTVWAWHGFCEDSWSYYSFEGLRAQACRRWPLGSDIISVNFSSKDWNNIIVIMLKIRACWCLPSLWSKRRSPEYLFYSSAAFWWESYSAFVWFDSASYWDS
jgi:hypothetical protein